jgi:hypothetical protein
VLLVIPMEERAQMRAGMRHALKDLWETSSATALRICSRCRLRPLLSGGTAACRFLLVLDDDVRQLKLALEPCVFTLQGAFDEIIFRIFLSDIGSLPFDSNFTKVETRHIGTNGGHRL